MSPVKNQAPRLSVKIARCLYRENVKDNPSAIGWDYLIKPVQARWVRLALEVQGLVRADLAKLDVLTIELVEKLLDN